MNKINKRTIEKTMKHLFTNYYEEYERFLEALKTLYELDFIDADTWTHATTIDKRLYAEM